MIEDILFSGKGICDPEPWTDKAFIGRPTKPWQFGYDIDYLKFLEKEYEPYNRYSLSPFAKFKKNDIAKALSDNSLHIKSYGFGLLRMLKFDHRSICIKMF